ncbi:NADH-dependent flavin oxidoreductase [Gracilibacillus sp. S3-1-1]|uniref:NADH-dependent flavin oxidoreductase n=1 Tax=Gracilibacillus pellucidus TaxID=3095368 RepID=A0ACC6M372_9BACI|nr:NADH-dependent flavin oxidoreductase [Gracilibacillus sp. S3-1-1]MDX8045382.1 NADH-dependent flavin oxidoreductase [Gracilibacillus sp. S3-1-1]
MNHNNQDMFSPLTLKNGVELKNRLVMAPMTHTSSNPDGTVSDEEVRYYAHRSKGVSMVITATTYVTPNGMGFPNQFAADRDDMVPSLRKLAKGIQDEGAKAILQIFHGGKLCPPALVPDGDVVSASDIPSDREGAAIPRPLEEAEIEEIIEAFGETTRRAIEAGFDGVEIHGANGYLIQQFFSPYSNRREDRFGGSLEKRMTFPLKVIDKVQSVVAEHGNEDFIVGYRFSPEEPETPGITMKETLHLVDVLADKNLDYLHVSLINFFSNPRRGVDDLTKTRIHHLLETINNRVPLIGVGSIYTAEDARKAFETGIPLLALGRELIIDPDWVQKVAEGRDDEIITEIDKAKQEELVIPNQLWKNIVNTPGWFPGV